LPVAENGKGERSVATRMLCTECFETSRPLTLLAGSDRLELAGWLCLALPGWLYCAWRHALRTKACARCGGRSLVREARAAAARHGGAPLAPPPPVHSLGARVRWPQPLATPRQRLKAGMPGVLAALATLLAGVVAAAGPAAAWLAAACAGAALALAATWLARQTRLWLRPRACRAWLADGRELEIELV